MLPESFWNFKLWDSLLRVDDLEAERVRQEGCGHCGGVLHCAGYGRKPRGVTDLLGSKRADLVFCHSFCCGTCRRRTMPASVRFPGRRVYVGLAVVLLPALLGDGSPSAALSACRRLHLSDRTLRRWRRWWQEEFSSSRFWRAHRGRLVPGAAARFPGGLLEAFRPQPQVEPLLVGMTFDAAPSLGEPLRVAVVATWTHLRATRNRVPGHFRPFDFRTLRHVRILRSKPLRGREEIAQS